jgi:general stress protein 26
MCRWPVARVVDDRAKIEELWSPAMKLFFLAARMTPTCA